MNSTVKSLWPELDWIKDSGLREKTARVWEEALKRSELTADDLNRVPFTLLVPDVQVSFMAHKRTVVHLAKVCGENIKTFLGKELPVNMDVLISGAILCDVGKLLEYELKDGKVVQGNYGKYIRHPFSGVSLAEANGLPAAVCHIIAAHAGEGDLVKRTVEATIVHHADFMTFLPFKDRFEL
jgi:putative nucleotidyltransferase with HDIG domain